MKDTKKIIKEEDVLEEAKRIMNKFLEAIKEVDDSVLKEFGVEREESVRVVDSNLSNNLSFHSEKEREEFVDLMLRNAPKTRHKFIVAEKKKWQ